MRPDDTCRFWKSVDKITSCSGCWLWTGRRNNSTGRAVFRTRRNKKVTQHYAARWLIQQTRTLSPQERVLHRCDNVSCVNPDHLFVGTQADNVRDMVQKGRSRLLSTRCARGHDLTQQQNVRQYGPDSRYRACRPCGRMFTAIHRSRKRAASLLTKAEALAYEG
jgi:hypothetical protein